MLDGGAMQFRPSTLGGSSRPGSACSRPRCCPPAFATVMKACGTSRREGQLSTPTLRFSDRPACFGRLVDVSGSLGPACLSVYSPLRGWGWGGGHVDVKGRGDDGTPPGKTGNRRLSRRGGCNLQVRQKQEKVSDPCPTGSRV